MAEMEPALGMVRKLGLRLLEGFLLVYRTQPLCLCPSRFDLILPSFCSFVENLLLLLMHLPNLQNVLHLFILANQHFLLGFHVEFDAEVHVFAHLLFFEVEQLLYAGVWEVAG